MIINHIIKSNGVRQEFNADKLNKWAEFAASFKVDWSPIALSAYRKCFDGCTTLELHKAMIDACVEQEDHKHLQMAGRLLIGTIYKEAFGGFRRIPHLKIFYAQMHSLGFWASLDYTEHELDYLNDKINHNQDITYNYTSLRQMKDKYLITDKVQNHCYESPQFMFMGMALQNMENQPKSRRLEDVIELYNYLSTLKINAPTPMLINMRTPHKAYASCCVYTTEDTVKSLAAGDHIAYLMTCASAGIGAFLKTRSKGDKVKGGRVVHQGKLPYYRLLQSAVHANIQASRGGSATVYFNVLDPEIKDLLALKNPTTVSQKQIKDIDYALVVNHFFAEKVAKNEEWMLISVQVAPDLHDAFYTGNLDEFKRLYDYYLKFECKKTMCFAREIMIQALTEAVETGRVYWCAADEMNRHTPFKDPIYSSNLCAEIALPTQAFTDMQDLYSANSKGEIALCSLASIVVGRVDDQTYEKVAYYTALMLDHVIDIMDYPFDSLGFSAKARRSIGIGITNLAHDMAQRHLSYQTLEGKNHIHYVAERHSYYLHKASLRLAQEKGICTWMTKSKYPQGWLPIDTYCKEVDKCHTQTLQFDWEGLRTQIIAQGGIRHSVLEAMMPVESSSQTTNTTNSIYPIRNLKIMKTSSNNKNLLIAPDADTLGDFYDIAWDLDSIHLIELYAIVQKFTGQAISADLYLNFKDKNGQASRKISTKKLLVDFLSMIKLGCKTRYYVNSSSGIRYQNPNKGATQTAAHNSPAIHNPASIHNSDIEYMEEDNCAGGACKL
ncbi:ribonucleoside-diphosphate reductase 1 alpha subunit [Gammaproteobacteria bacterium]|nr:ribonucleoside-diphosphate reductase 1 alpha subunit [Gammaproteobacteria bacterium]